ncbi:uncharacterized protein MONBRDRAFT_34436 [Monosiga brevicollis MX1]|uniref:Pre-mRNA-processing factor 17 n=1 Tax=Monosiga brevicollis TaxID=81824 RepID=A9VBS1_MONBE|nr:uncharacterized protein MONBRDRAFT_34436 [Monosiga brevicollis MX1]EDQ84982.1 predicted protein [Monosiga brevicollis MX1]|eukprot:XP_001750152.1 hypothetical protein [Monosiga brevicollis MX1]
MAALGNLAAAYGSASSDEEDEAPQNVKGHVKTSAKTAPATSIAVNTAPSVPARPTESGLYHISPAQREISYNPKAEELFAPVVGPRPRFENPTKHIHFNTYTGHVEQGDIDSFHFDDQQRTFAVRGYAADPSVSHTVGNNRSQGHCESLVHTKRTKGSKKKHKGQRESRGDPADLDAYLGPWAAPKTEQRIAKPSEEEQKILDEYAEYRKNNSKNKKKSRDDEDEDAKHAKDEGDESSILHLKEEYDYQGRSWMEPGPVEDVSFGEAPEKCYLPKTQVHTYEGHTKGVNAVRFFPRTGHLLLSAGLDGKVKLWKVYDDRQVVRTYLGHTQGVRDICFNRDGTRFVSCGYDRYARLWDTETGQCLGRFTNHKTPYCVKFHPDEDKQNLFVVGTQDRKILTWDTNTQEIVQEYDRHLGAVNTVTFVENGKRMVTTSDDKSLRVWEWDIPVDIKYIADPNMHSMPSVALRPDGKWLACQSMDNQVVIFSAQDRFRPNHRKAFKGHLTAGYACQVNFSPDGAYVMSGDAHGYCCIWDWKSKRMYNKFKAHDKVCIGVEWNPYHKSTVATCGWDGKIKLWM